ncbi:MAG TPA: aminoacetone oxidase family FAD-binding enzyme [Gemmatimonadaceae bacterium]
MTGRDVDAELCVIGAGAAGLATAIFAARNAPSCRVVCVDGARTLGAKILVSGGSRCNVTNREVTERDFWGGSSRFVRNVLRAFPAARTVTWFAELGVTLHEEEDGKLFPDSNSSRTVLRALLNEAELAGVSLTTGARVVDVRREQEAFVTLTAAGREIRSRRVVICTGGKSLPKTGSDGFGYELVRRLGHSCIEPVPALAPLVFDGWETLTGVAHPAALALRIDGRSAVSLQGPILWTHFGASGPLALNMSRHWHRAHGHGQACTVTINVCPGENVDTLNAWLREQDQQRPRARVTTVVATRLPAIVAGRWADTAGIAEELTMAHLTREQRHALVHSLLDTTLPVSGSRGFAYAEVTAGGVPLEEVDPATMESRVCPGLYLAGEILDVDGRLGGFNFQWAWSSAWVAAQAIARTER